MLCYGLCGPLAKMFGDPGSGTEFAKNLCMGQTCIVCVSMTAPYVHSAVVRHFCKGGKMGGKKLWK